MLIQCIWEIQNTFAKLGRVPETPVRGKIITPYLDSCEAVTAPCGCGTFYPLNYTFKVPKTINPDFATMSPQIRLMNRSTNL